MEDASETKNKAGPTISSGSPTRPRGIFFHGGGPAMWMRDRTQTTNHFQYSSIANYDPFTPFQHVSAYVLKDTHDFRPNLLNQFRASYIRLLDVLSAGPQKTANQFGINDTPQEGRSGWLRMPWRHGLPAATRAVMPLRRQTLSFRETRARWGHFSMGFIPRLCTTSNRESGLRGIPAETRRSIPSEYVPAGRATRPLSSRGSTPS